MKFSVLIAFMLSVVVCFTANAQKKAQTLLWQIEGNGLKQPSFLLGVDHGVDGVFLTKKYPVILEKLSIANTLIQEVDPNDPTPPIDLNIVNYQGDTTIQQLLNPADFKIIIDFFNKKTNNDTGVINYVLKARPQYLHLAIVTEFSGKGSEAQPNTIDTNIIYLESFLINEAFTAGKKITGLENGKERTALLVKSVDDKTAFEQVLTDIKNDSLLSHPTTRSEQESKKNKALEKLKQEHYINLKVDYFLGEKFDGKDFGGVRKRNELWMSKLPGLLEQESCFIAVGFDHLIALI